MHHLSKATDTASSDSSSKFVTESAHSRSSKSTNASGHSSSKSGTALGHSSSSKSSVRPLLLQVRHSFRPLLLVQLSHVSRLRRLSNHGREPPQLWCVAVRVEVVQKVQAETSDINIVQAASLLVLRGLTT